MREPKPTISYGSAKAEVESILQKPMADDLDFQRGNMCLRIMGCPVKDNGKFNVVEDMEGPDARELWDLFENQREMLKELHDIWKETQEDA